MTVVWYSCTCTQKGMDGILYNINIYYHTPKLIHSKCTIYMCAHAIMHAQLVSQLNAQSVLPAEVV